VAFDEELAERIRARVSRMKHVEEKRLFGGLGFMLNGNMLVGVWKQSLIVRLGPDASEAALLEPHVRVFDVTGKPMKGWVMVEAEGVEDEGQVKEWVQRALKFVEKLPAK